MTTTQFKSVADMFLQRVQKAPHATAFQFPRGNTWESLSWQQTGDRVRAIACGLRSLGVKDEERCAIVSSTRIEWILADLGIMCAGGATTTIYPSNTAEECSYIIHDSTTVVAFVEDESQLQKVLSVRSQLPSLKKIVVFEELKSEHADVISLSALEALGKNYERDHAGEYEKIAFAISKDRLATLIYTSGTTGKPKGVELIHDCWVAQAQGIDALNLLGPEDLQYLWLPLSHVFGKILQVMQLHIGFATAVDGAIPKLVDNLAVVRPTFMAAAPRIFEKVYNKVVSGASEAGGLKLKIFRWAMRVGKAASILRQQDRPVTGFLALQHRLADKLVFSKLRARFGGRIRFFVSGSAPLSRDMAEFFHACGILILEGYGLTESSAANFVNRLESYRFGTVGLAIPGIQIRIAPEDGEVLLSGRAIMRGYHNSPEATREAFTADGFLHTGDIGELDKNGFLKITDRKKDLIKTSGGKYIAPQLLESRLKALCPYISQVIIHGDRRNFCSALVSVDEEGLARWAGLNGKSGVPYKDLSQSPEVFAMVNEAVQTLNKQLARHETVKKFAILEKDLTIEDGDLTPSMKVKRKVVEQKYKGILDGFYKDALSDVA